MGLLEQDPAAAAASGRVLLVDDNDEVRTGLRRMLTLAGHVVREAASGPAAIALLASEQFDFVVSDVRMPDMDGVKLLKAIHETDAELPVLLLSGAPDVDSAMQAVEYGALEYLAKPVALSKLRASAARALELRQKSLAARAQSGVKSVGGPRAAGSTSDDLEGSLLAGRYRVGPLLGVGGMGAVYEGVREDLGGMAVAVKVLHSDLGADADGLRRFRREAHLLAGIDHPNIVRVIDFLAPAGEPAFIVMERLHGHSLGDAVRRERHFSVQEAVWIGTQVLGALGAAHSARVVHRDLKPDNVFLTSLAGVSDVVKLLDFGVAKLSGSQADEKLTQTGTVMGTPAYMAPEQARGEAADARSDLYAVGGLLFEALTGRPPFIGGNYNALMFQINEGTPPPLLDLCPELDPAFAAIIVKAMARDAADRFQSAREFSDAVAPWLTSATNRAGPVSSPAAFAATIRPPSTRRPRTRP